ncbi:hypothetical protein [Marinospirillum perlucidum]|uniref:hypothetical protein n=1 Tax=Marinospirillum perlucidum TaxID=1982602 RepID=UPI000DF3FEFC|nr:hypothetical protein [Marinospirillum perlucidum]
MNAFDLIPPLLRLLINHLLLLIWYLQLFLAFAGQLDWPVVPTLLLPLLLLVGVGFWMNWAFYYPRRKLLWVHLVGFFVGVLALAVHPAWVPVALLITLAAIAYPCHQCIRLQLPGHLQEADS